jgi:Rieske Fe-S protein
MTTSELDRAPDRSLSRRGFLGRAAVAAGGVAVTVAVAGCAGGSAAVSASGTASALSDGPRYSVALADAPELSNVGGVLRVKHNVALAEAAEPGKVGGVLGEEHGVAVADAAEGGVLGEEQEKEHFDFDFYIVRQSEDAVIALNNVCSHKNCATKYDAATNDFACPCHKSRFDLEGAPHGGPAKEPLKRYPATLADGVVTVALQI